MKQQGYKVLLQQERHLNDHDARELHRHKMNEVRNKTFSLLNKTFH